LHKASSHFLTQKSWVTFAINRIADLIVYLEFGLK